MARKLCVPCGRHFEPSSPAQKYHDATCRQKAHRNKSLAAEVVQLPGTKPAAPNAEPVTLEATVHRELEKAKRLDTALGVHVLRLAARLDRAERETGAALAQLDKAFRSAYAEALADAEEEGDELDDLRGQAVRLLAR